MISDCHFRKTATEYDRKTGIKWSSCTEKWQSGTTPGKRAAVREERRQHREISNLSLGTEEVELYLTLAAAVAFGGLLWFLMFHFS